MSVVPQDPQRILPNPLNPLRLGAGRSHDAIMPSMQGLAQQVQTARRTGALFDGFQRGILSAQGQDRTRFLHNLMSHDIKGLVPGQGRPACLLDRQGKILFASIVHSRPNELLLELDPSSISSARKHLERYRISEVVEFRDLSEHLSILPLHGPAAPELLSRAWPGFQQPEQSLSHCEGPGGSGVQLLIRWDLFRMPGFHLWIQPTQLEAVRSRILSEGQALGIIQAGPDLFETLRIETGVPWPGSEMDETVILNELGTEEFISFTKGCFVGQEIVARIKYRAHPPRLLAGLLLEGSEIPAKGSPIELESQIVGVITSACLSPTLQRPIALGFLKYGTEATHQLTVRTPSGPAHAKISKLPFVPVSPSS